MIKITNKPIFEFRLVTRRYGAGSGMKSSLWKGKLRSLIGFLALVLDDGRLAVRNGALGVLRSRSGVYSSDRGVGLFQVGDCDE